MKRSKPAFRLVAMVSVIAILCSFSPTALTEESSNTKNIALFEAFGKAAENMAGKSEDWIFSGNWTTETKTNGSLRFSSEGTANEEAFFPKANLSGTWRMDFRLDISEAGRKEAVVKVPLGISAKSARVNVVFTRHPAGLISISVDVVGSKGRVLHSGWLPGGDSVLDVSISRKDPAANALCLEVYGDNTLRYCETTPDLENPNEVVKGVGFTANQFPLTVTDFCLSTQKPDGEYMTMARQGINDMIQNFWEKGVSTGHIATTWCGYAANKLPDRHGMMWERALMVIPMYSLYRTTRDPLLEKRLCAEWKFIQSQYTEAELAAAGSGLHPAVDDSGWGAMTYLCLYQVTGDEAALRAAQQMADNAINRWQDDTLGGGLWYNNDRSYKSIYQCGILTTLLTLWEITGTDAAKEKFFKVYDWIESKVRRDDGLYWVDIHPNGPDGESRPYDIKETASVSCLMANMSMGIINARLYRATGDEAYQQKAIDTAEGIYKHETIDGIYLNDRDAWANGTFASEWAVQVLSLPNIDPKHGELLKKTAKSIYTNARTGDGYYGGSWTGPADGINSKWFTVGSRPQQIMTTGNSVNILVAAAILESQGR